MATEQERDKIQELEARLDRLEREQPPQHLRDWLDRLVPREVRQHLRAARREQLLAARAYLDHVIQRMDEPEKAGGQRRRIEVE